MSVGQVSFAREGVSGADWAWFLEDLDFDAGEAVFVRASRPFLSDSIFLDQRIDRRAADTRRVPFSAVEAAAAGERSAAIIWHTSFCCSTLIASCLDWPGLSVAVKEPRALVELSGAMLKGTPSATDDLVQGVFKALGRGPNPRERVILKPSNGANGLISAAGAGDSPMLMLYSSCRDYLTSVAWGGPVVGGADLRKSVARSLLAERALSAKPTMRWTAADLCTLTDFQAAAILWHVQVAEMRAAAETLGPGRVRALDCALFLADPIGVLNDLDAFFDLGLGRARVAEIAVGSKLKRYAKKPDEVFDTARRNQIFKRVDQALGPSLDAVVAWSYQVCPETPRRDPVGTSVIGLGASAPSRGGVVQDDCVRL